MGSVFRNKRNFLFFSEKTFRSRYSNTFVSRMVFKMMISSKEFFCSRNFSRYFESIHLLIPSDNISIRFLFIRIPTFPTYL